MKFPGEVFSPKHMSDFPASAARDLALENAIPEDADAEDRPVPAGDRRSFERPITTDHPPAQERVHFLLASQVDRA